MHASRSIDCQGGHRGTLIAATVIKHFQGKEISLEDQANSQSWLPCRGMHSYDTVHYHRVHCDSMNILLYLEPKPYPLGRMPLYLCRLMVLIASQGKASCTLGRTPTSKHNTTIRMLSRSNEINNLLSCLYACTQKNHTRQRCRQGVGAPVDAEPAPCWRAPLADREPAPLPFVVRAPPPPSDSFSSKPHQRLASTARRRRRWGHDAARLGSSATTARNLMQ